MRLLLTNDDGIDARGMAALREALHGLGELWVVAPHIERSASSHAITMHAPLRAHARGERAWAVEGTPVDCAYLGLVELLPERPDLVVSGINHGSNVGTDIVYSGTVAAAAEARLMGVPSVAISLNRPGRDSRHWDTAAAVARRVVQHAAANGLPDDVFLNVNVPDLPLSKIKGLKATVMGRRHYGLQVDARIDHFGRPYYWIGGPHERFDPIPRSDGPAMEQGWVSVSPLAPNFSHPASLEAVAAWTDA